MRVLYDGVQVCHSVNKILGKEGASLSRASPTGLAYVWNEEHPGIMIEM